MFDINEIPVTKFVVIGSYALQTRTCSDIDIVCYAEDINVNHEELTYIKDHTITFTFNNKKIECLLADYQESFQILLKSVNTAVTIASPELCYAIKRAHIHRANVKWEKHISDYTQLSKIYHFHQPIPELPNMSIFEFSQLHSKALDEVLSPQRQVPLYNVTKEQFFDDYVKKYVDHDWLHVVYAHKEQPMYTYLQDDPAIVYCNPAKWEQLTYNDKLKCVLEECYVIAVERFLIKDLLINKQTDLRDIHKAFKASLIKVCTTLTSGFFRMFAIDNYYMLLNNYDTSFLEKTKEALKGHTIVVS